MKHHRVLHVIGGGEIGGAEKHVLSLLTGLGEYGYDPSLICLCAGPFCDKASGLGIKAATIEMHGKLDITKIAPMRAYMQNEKIDIVHTHGVRANLVARKAAKSLRLPVVTTFHSAVAHDYSSRIAALTADFITRATNSNTDEFIAISEAIRKDVLKMNVAPEHVTTIYNGIDFNSKLLNARQIWRQRFGVDDAAMVVGMVARLHEVKGHIYLLEAMKILMGSFPDIRLVLVGDGPYKETVETKIRELGIGNNVIMSGFIENLLGVYDAFDVVCLPSLMEGMGITLLEAMHEGAPVVASKVGGIPELVRDGIDGILVTSAQPAPLAAALQRVLCDKALSRKLIASAKQRAELFSRTVMLQATSALYDRLLERDVRVE